ncbi:putative membrane protein [Roseovarius nanhaiticus]|uniref:Putative membrane protein n=1 Tax=Roseovarius nanhaiticus TaxID=573024 RepID=A0A1N7E7E5_9RHOB|nr:bestrophin family protein [Roseovarius nanhaiticus]SEK80160.1 putative membrane protein [Roseovarius nanhaiticus]SIR83959.1 putative membrane protein [Roseovarius nanhaiticus]
MIIRDKPGVLQLLFSVRGSVLPRIVPRIVVVTGFAALLVWFDTVYTALPHPDPAPFAVFGIALSLFLGFRNNAAHNRWWEGRKLWGQLIADMRSLARDVEIFLPEQEDRKKVLRLAIGFIHAHRINLRKLPTASAPREWLSENDMAQPHPPCAILDRMAETVARAAPDGFARRALAERLASISIAQAGCERIATTPLPYVYSLLIFRTTYLYCGLIPFGLIESAGWMSLLFVAIIAYIFFGLAEVTEELAHPFGETVNGLSLDAMCRTIEISLAPHLDIPAPAPKKAERFYLS